MITYAGRTSRQYATVAIRAETRLMEDVQWEEDRDAGIWICFDTLHSAMKFVNTRVTGYAYSEFMCRWSRVEISRFFLYVAKVGPDGAKRWDYLETVAR